MNVIRCTDVYVCLNVYAGKSKGPYTTSKSWGDTCRGRGQKIKFIDSRTLNGVENRGRVRQRQIG